MSQPEDGLPDYRLGTAYHEVGHAVVLHSLGVKVERVRIEFAADQWRGGTDVPQGVIDGLSPLNQIVAWYAGRAAEEFFKCPSYQSAWWDDMERIYRILSKAGVPEDRHWLVKAEAKKKANAIFSLVNDKALKLAALLVEKERIDRPEFLQLIDT